MTRGPLTQRVAEHHTVLSACCGQPEDHAIHARATARAITLDSGIDFQWHPFKPIKLASGGVAGPDGYLDLRAALLCGRQTCGRRYATAIEDAYFAFSPGGEAWMVTTGAFGALLLGMIQESRSLLWTPKDHGLECTPFPPPPAGTKVVLVDDVVTTREPCCEHGADAHDYFGAQRDDGSLTGPWCDLCKDVHVFKPGGTMWRMRRWCESKGYEVVAEIEAAAL